MAVYFHIPSNYSVDHVREHVVTKTFGNYWISVTLMFSAMADDSKLPPYIILNHKTIPQVAIFKKKLFFIPIYVYYLFKWLLGCCQKQTVPKLFGSDYLINGILGISFGLGVP